MAASPAILAARLIQESHGTPLASIYHIPFMIASSSAPPVMMGAWTLPRWAPRPVAWAYWRCFDAAGSALIGPQLAEVRRSLGLPPVKRIFQWWGSPQLGIGLFPDWYSPQQPDWPPQLRVAGFPNFDGDGDATLDPAVRQFCDAGEPPIVVTFGTGMQHAAELHQAVVQALQQSGRAGCSCRVTPGRCRGDCRTRSGTSPTLRSDTCCRSAEVSSITGGSAPRPGRCSRGRRRSSFPMRGISSTMRRASNVWAAAHACVADARRRAGFKTPCSAC